MIKSREAKGKARVTFTVDPQVGARAAAVCGEWNDWSADADVMHRDAEGGFSVTVDLDAGRAYRFRYLLSIPMNPIARSGVFDHRESEAA